MFRVVEGTNGAYEVADTGIVRSLPRTIVNKHGKTQTYPGRTLAPDRAVTGHLRVTMSVGNKQIRKQVHRLVARAYIPNPNNKPCVNHIDNDPSNNNVANLEWCTHSENMLHAQRQGRLFASQSKGGNTLGTTGTHARATKQAMLGATYSCWKVIALADRRGKKQYFTVVCTKCGAKYTREKSYILHSKQSNCIKCKTR